MPWKCTILVQCYTINAWKTLSIGQDSCPLSIFSLTHTFSAHSHYMELHNVLSPLSLSQSPFHIHVLSVSGYRCVFPELSVSTLSCQGMMLHSSARQWRRRKWDESSSSSSSSLWYMWCYISILYIGTVLLEFYSILWLRSYLPHAAHSIYQ